MSSAGKYVENLNSIWQTYGSKQAVALVNGTAAHLASAGVKAGEEVLLPALTLLPPPMQSYIKAVSFCGQQRIQPGPDSEN